ncbi:hypothetical protein LBMAG53_17490 [Planctomycetota bacterium]|nr:hypothetical protein LBMAG53_17490 [Planctomycetota bacterium]
MTDLTASLRVVLLTIVLAVFLTTGAAEPLPAPAQPIRFDIQLGPAQFPAGKPKAGAPQPAVLGGYIEVWSALWARVVQHDFRAHLHLKLHAGGIL